MAGALPEGWARRLLPPGAGAITGPVHGSPLLPPARSGGELPYLAISMVATVDGRVAVGGRAAGLGSPTDRRLLRRLRAEADALLHGAGTLRAERFAPRVPAELVPERLERGQPAQPTAVAVSASGELAHDHPYFRSASPAWPRLVYTLGAGGRGLERPGVEVRRLGAATLDLREVLRDLVRRGLRRVLCEGGPTLNRALLAAGVVDELFVTVAPRIVAGAHPLTLVAGDDLGPLRLRLRSLYEREGELFARYGTGE